VALPLVCGFADASITFVDGVGVGSNSEIECLLVCSTRSVPETTHHIIYHSSPALPRNCGQKSPSAPLVGCDIVQVQLDGDRTNYYMQLEAGHSIECTILTQAALDRLALFDFVTLTFDLLT